MVVKKLNAISNSPCSSTLQKEETDDASRVDLRTVKALAYPSIHTDSLGGVERHSIPEYVNLSNTTF
ncbi:hypothetical protein ANCCEY_06334 [Ancylostoma ceylanicum]|uniref:Uncharacterized protein n=1 Tax=Ancylostoma ceylanicum TaxID=53326 RepID=A0A0D6LTQ0_9BILA|nr:hypothetical protein ANCCEY_06334 [Ancylostoma ceylanicum]